MLLQRAEFMFPEGPGRVRAVPRVGAPAPLINALIVNTKGAIDELWKQRGYDSLKPDEIKSRLGYRLDREEAKGYVLITCSPARSTSPFYRRSRRPISACASTTRSPRRRHSGNSSRSTRSAAPATPRCSSSQPPSAWRRRRRRSESATPPMPHRLRRLSHHHSRSLPLRRRCQCHRQAHRCRLWQRYRTPQVDYVGAGDLSVPFFATERHPEIPGYRGRPGGDDEERFWNPAMPPCVPSDHRPANLFKSREAAAAAGAAARVELLAPPPPDEEEYGEDDYNPAWDFDEDEY